MRSHAGASILLAVIASCAHATPREPPSSVHAITANRTLESWKAQGFVEMVPALMPATTPESDERITVWLRFPENAKWHARWSSSQRSRLPNYPVGTQVDRVDLLSSNGQWRIADVRGTSILPTDQEFHVLRPSPSSLGRLAGFAWNRDDGAGQKIATRDLVALSCGASRAEVATLAKRNSCVDCHAREKPARRLEVDDDLPVRPTDFAGFYEILSVLRDASEVNDTRGRDVNVDDPHVHLQCANGAAAVDRNGARVAVVCAGSRDVPVASYDLEAALGSGDDHARAVCASRCYLLEHAADDAKTAFFEAFRECGL